MTVHTLSAPTYKSSAIAISSGPSLRVFATEGTPLQYQITRDATVSQWIDLGTGGVHVLEPVGSGDSVVIRRSPGAGAPSNALKIVTVEL